MLQDSPHVAIFLRSLIGGGAERIIVNLAQGFVERGLRVDLLLKSRWTLPVAGVT